MATTLEDLQAAERVLRAARSNFDRLLAHELADVIARYAGTHPRAAASGSRGEPLPRRRMSDEFLDFLPWRTRSPAENLSQDAVADVVGRLASAHTAIDSEDPNSFRLRLLACEVEDILIRFVGRWAAP